MPSQEMTNLVASPKKGFEKIGIIAGSGILPVLVAKACADQGYTVFIIALTQSLQNDLYSQYPHYVTRVGATQKTLDWIHAHGIRDLILIGGLRRPSLREIMPDWRTIRFFMRSVGQGVRGDDFLLRAVRHELEKEGLRIHAAQDFAPQLLAPEGVIGTHAPHKEDWSVIQRGFALSQMLGAGDIGQSIVIQEGIVLGVEAIEGTDALIARCGPLKRKGRKPILIKTCKPQQDRALDLPTIGLQTITQCIDSGFGGIVVQAGATFLLDLDSAVACADSHGLFLLGYEGVCA